MKTISFLFLLFTLSAPAADSPEKQRKAMEDRYGGTKPATKQPAPAQAPVTRPFAAVAARPAVQEESFVTLAVKGITYSNVVLRAYSQTEGTLRHGGGIEKIQLQDLPGEIRARFYSTNHLSEISEQEAEKRKKRVAAQNKIAAQERAEFIKENHPLRVIGTKLYDFSLYFTDPYVADGHPIRSRFHKYVLRGTVLQVIGDGELLVTRAGSDMTVHLRNHRGFAIDNSAIEVLAMPFGRYEYTNTQGAKATVLDWDCGRSYDYERDKFDQKIVVSADGEHAVPVTEFDKL